MLEQELKLTAESLQTLTEVLTSDLVKTYCVSDTNAGAEAYQAVYYDTDALDFQRHRCSLRARKEGPRFVAALKMAGRMVGGLSSREEYETPIHRWLESPADLPTGEFQDRVLAVVPMNTVLQSRVTVSMQRTTRNLTFGDAEIELVADNAEITGLNGKASLYEIELELKKGELHAVTELGQMLLTQFALRPSTTTKYGLGLSLC